MRHTIIGMVLLVTLIGAVNCINLFSCIGAKAEKFKSCWFYPKQSTCGLCCRHYGFSRGEVKLSKKESKEFRADVYRCYCVQPGGDVSKGPFLSYNYPDHDRC